MDIVLLDYYLRLFALIANLYPQVILENVKDFLKTSILKELAPEIGIESLKLFNEYCQEYAELKKSPENIDSYKVLIETVRLIDKNIPKKQKFQLLIRLLLFEKTLLRLPVGPGADEIEFSNILKLVVENLQISMPEFLNCQGFISDRYYNIPDKRKLLLVAGRKNVDLDILFLQRNDFQGQLFFLYIESTHTLLFNYKGKQPLTFNNQVLFSNHVYFFHKGSSIRGNQIEPVYYNQVLRRFQVRHTESLNVEVRNVEFRFRNSPNGIHKLSLSLASEQLIGIIGRSGVGKSTLINLLIGNIHPLEGSISINGLDLHRDNQKLDGLIGYVPQDDLLIEELSVFTNLLLNARLCFDGISPSVLMEKVKNLLVDFDLYEVRNLKVGSPLNRLISGGQRKKLNIALELIREPWILFADEPTSGLSSSDSEEIMQLLSEQTSKGRIVVVNIHQPSSDIFKLFDKIIVLDKEGYPVFFGNPLDAIPYFNDYYQRISTAFDNCTVCESINPEVIFKILEEKKTNEFSEYTKERKTSPAEWHQHFLSRISEPSEGTKALQPLPRIQFSKPNPFKQFFIFGKRNLLTKLASVQYVSMATLISPMLAILLALLCRYTNLGESNSFLYSFAQNENLPSYLFMSVIVALFVGLIMSAEEIIRDRKILLRESYLKLSRLSYLNSKVAFVFGLSALQTLLYVLIGNGILGIHGMTLSFWIILFSTSCFANLLGLLISSFFTSVVAIYIMVPLIIVPQILLSGVVVNYDKLNNYVASKEFVPFVGDVMASRWAYEALVVTQFKDNKFQKWYFDVEKQESNAKFNLLFVLPELKKVVAELKDDSLRTMQSRNIEFLRHEIRVMKEAGYDEFFKGITFRPLNLTLLEKRLDRLNDFLPARLNQLSQSKDSITHVLVSRLGGVDQYLQFKSGNYNNDISDLVLKRKDLESFVRLDNKIIRRMEPVYQMPASRYGRAHFLSSSKIVHNTVIGTTTFNLVAIWLMSLFTYALLIIFSTFIKRQN